MDEKLINIDWFYKKKLYDSVINDINIFTDISEPTASIIIISWRWHPDTLKSIKILEKERNQNFELIFVNNGKEKIEFESLFPYLDVYIELNTNTGAYLARNIGALFSKAPILIFLEDDGLPDIDFIKMHKKAHELYKPFSVRGICLPKTENEFNKFASHYYLGRSVFPYFVNLEGNCSYNAEKFFEVGGWDDQIIFGGGGPELSIRLYKRYKNLQKQIYWPYAVIFHDYASNDEHYKNKKIKQNKSVKRLRKKHDNWNNFFDLYDENQDILVDRCLSCKKVLERYNKKLDDYIKNTNRFFFKKEGSDFEKQVRLIRKKRKIAVFGAGSGGIRCKKILENKGFSLDIFIDNDTSKIGNFIDNIKISNIIDIKKENYFIFIASDYFFEISEQLEKRGFEPGIDFSAI